MRKFSVLVSFGLAVLLALPAACGDGRADLTGRDISDDELAAMVLALDELGSAYADFSLDEVGFATNEEEGEGGFAPEDEADDVERFGRINGYEAGYSPAEGSEGQPVVAVGTTVILFRDVDGASGNLKDAVEDGRRAIGKTSEGVRLEDVEEFDLSDVGDEAVGLVMTVSDESRQELRGYFAAFRRGRLMGVASIGRLDEEDVRGEVAALARKLDERILEVLREGHRADGHRPLTAAPPRRTIAAAEGTWAQGRAYAQGRLPVAAM